MRVPVSPFRVPPAGSIEHSGWSITGTGEPLPQEMTAWDHMTVLELSAEVRIDVAGTLTVCQLDTDTELALAIRATSDTTNIRRVVNKVALSVGESRTVPLLIELPGHEFGGRLTIETLLVAAAPSPLSEDAASQPGSILWTSNQRTRLQGIGSQFPTDAADFRSAGHPEPEAAWDLRVDLADPDAVFMSAVRLTLNTGHPAVVRLLEGAKDEQTQQLRRTLHWDVTRQLVEYAFSCDEAMEADFDREATTLAGVLRNIVALVWPSTSTATLRTWHEQDRARIETHIQQHCRLVP